MAMYRTPFVPNDFQIPKGLWLSNCTIKPLKIEYVELDYAAVIDNLDENGEPLYPNHTLYQNTIDLGYHQKEFQKRISFAYTILTLTEDECLGCIYIYPADDEAYDVEVDMWIRNKYALESSDIMNSVRDWIGDEWEYSNPKFMF